jgi:hypothetical protein
VPEPPLPQGIAPTLVEGEDYYRDGPYIVFTEAYHRRRGYCCDSGCRHCPWRDEENPAETQLSEGKPS